MTAEKAVPLNVKPKPKPKALLPALDLDLYREYRAYVVHEDDLMNNRMNWFIQLHSFLIASYAITLGAMVTTFFPQSPPPPNAWMIQTAIAIVSVGIAAIGFQSSSSAIDSISVSRVALDAIRTRWESLQEEGLAPTDRRLLPITYAGDKPKTERPHLERDLPKLMKILWVMSAVISFAFVAIAVWPKLSCPGAPGEIPYGLTLRVCFRIP